MPHHRHTTERYERTTRMNTATLALQNARPATSPASGAARVQDDASSTHRFDAALDAAHARAGDRQSPRQSTSPAAGQAAGTPAKAPAKDAATDDDKKDARTDEGDRQDDASIAATMLSLIGVPPKATDAAAKVVDAAADAATATPSGALPGVVAAAPGDVSGIAAPGEDPKLAGPMLDADRSAAATNAPAAIPFNALLAGQGAGSPTAKDDTAGSLDAVDTASPMPLAPSPSLHAGVPAVQVQATQSATTPQFAQELGEQIAWMGAGQVKEARIKLHPEELGSMDVRVQVDAGKVNVAIIAQHPAAVHAVQQTLSQLDTMLAHHGLSLGQADVGQRGAGQDAQRDAGSAGGAGDIEPAPSDVAATTRVSSRGLVDEVA